MTTKPSAKQEPGHLETELAKDHIFSTVCSAAESSDLNPVALARQLITAAEEIYAWRPTLGQYKLQNDLFGIPEQMFEECSTSELSFSEYCINGADWDECGTSFNYEILKGRKCFGALDCASVRGITTFALLFPPLINEEDGWWYALAWCFAPKENTIEPTILLSVYTQWVKYGWLTETAGCVTDFDAMLEAIMQAARDFDVQKIAFDPWNSTHLANQLLGKDVPMVKLPQNFSGLSAGTKLLSLLVRNKQLQHGGNKLLEWCGENTALLINTDTGDIKPSKPASRGPISPIIALTMAATMASTDMDCSHASGSPN